MSRKSTVTLQKSKKHTVRAGFETSFLRRLAKAGQIKISSDGRVYGFEEFVKRMSKEFI